jgi:hypothetical protein
MPLRGCDINPLYLLLYCWPIQWLPAAITDVCRVRPCCYRTLLAACPDYFKQEWFTPEAYLWAVELWYAYAIQVGWA